MRASVTNSLLIRADRLYASTIG